MVRLISLVAEIHTPIGDSPQVFRWLHLVSSCAWCIRRHNLKTRHYQHHKEKSSCHKHGSSKIPEEINKDKGHCNQNPCRQMSHHGGSAGGCHLHLCYVRLSILWTTTRRNLNFIPAFTLI